MVAEYDSPEALIAAATKATDAGYTCMDAFTPFPVHGMPDAIAFDEAKVPWVIFVAGCIGGCCGFALQWWVCQGAYPTNVGGRPYFSWPSFIPVTFECTVLFAAFGAVLSMIGLNKLPQPYHPVFDTPRFNRASQDLFFLAIEAKDPKYSSTEAKDFLEGTGARLVSEVGMEEAGDW